MFVTKNQFFVFVACVAFGVVLGAFICCVNLIFSFMKNKKILHSINAVCLLLMGAGFSYYSYQMCFPNFRLYMLFGVILGVVGYFKSFHIILAKFCKKFYNGIIKNKSRVKGINDRAKNKKNDSGINGRGSVAFGNASINNGLSNDSNKG